MITIHLGLNSLDPSTWTIHAVDDLPTFMFATFGDYFPRSGRIFHEAISVETDVTPVQGNRESVEKLLSLKGTLYVIIYPEGQALAAQGFANAILLVAALTLSLLIKPEGKISSPPAFNRVLSGSPNKQLANRQNTARPLGRIPDIYGLVRSTPDLLQEVYTLYQDHRETEISYMCVGRGSYLITDEREGDILVGQIEGMSVVTYGPGEIPGGGTPDNVIGEMIEDPVYVVRNVLAVNGQPLLAPNAKTFIGDIPRNVGSDSLWMGIGFQYPSAGVGEIVVGGTPDEVNDKVKVGDTLEIVYPVTRTNAGDGLDLSDPVNPLSKNGELPFKMMVFLQQGIGGLPDLTSDATNFVTVTAIDTAIAIPATTAKLTVSVPGPLQAEWAKINTYTAGFAPIFQGEIENNGCFITAQNREWIGPFFVQSSVAPPSEQVIVCNFVAQDGLYADDGKTQKAFTARLEVEITPVDNAGVPTADPVQTETSVLTGTVLSRNTRAVTMKIVPNTPGNFSIRARRLTRTPWKQDAPSQYRVFIDSTLDAFASALALTGPRVAKNNGGTNPNEISAGVFTNSSYLPFAGTVQDDIRWTHCYTLTTIAPISLGDITTIHTRTIATEGATSNTKRKLNVLAYRLIQTWTAGVFGGALTQDNKCENVLASILTDPYIGNVDPSLLDPVSIVGSFEEVRAMFGGPTSDGFGGDEAGQFNYTFDDDRLSLEDMCGIVCQAGFCLPYRDSGGTVKVKPDIATTEAELVLNHRNKLPGSEQRTVNFGTEADYDGVRLDYVETDINDPLNFAIKTYTIPPNGVAVRPRVLEVPGIRTKKHAAWHAWRAYNRILYSNTVSECQVCEEAMMLTLHSRILIADGTRTDPQDGEITAISGSTITTSQPVDISSGPHTVFLQHTDNTVESIAVASSPNSHQLVLAAPPIVLLVTDGNEGVRTMYMLVKNDATLPQAFNVAEKSCTGRGTYAITATNYSHLFYANDGLMFWLPFIVQTGISVNRDWGPYELSTSSLGSTVSDGVRGDVYEGSVSSEHISITTANVFASPTYTKSAWVYRTFQSTVQPTSIICSVETSDEQFRISTGAEIRGVHNNTVYASAVVPNSLLDWHMYTMSYNDVTDVMRIYYDGELLDEAFGVPGRPIGNLRIFGNFAGSDGLVGRGDEVRYWMRELAPEEVRELYQKTRL